MRLDRHRGAIIDALPARDSEFGADAVVRDPRELVDILRERVPPP